MKKNVLFLATVPSMIVSFNMRNIHILQEMGYKIHIACNFKDHSAWTNEQVTTMKDKLQNMDAMIHQIDFPRKPYHPLQLLRSYWQLKKLIKKESFILMHNQSCVSGILGRIAFRKKRTKIMHTEHGFYYFKGSFLLNWIFYPFDRLCSRWTDILLVINHDDFNFARKNMKAKRVVYIPGIGIDTDYYENTVIDKEKKRSEFGIPMNAFVILSVGELNQNKNHIVIINAIEKLNNENIYYVICGEGSEKNSLLNIIEKKKLDRQVILTGHRYDVNELYKMADLFAFPSKREGLGLAALEAMASGLSLVTSNKNGIKDYAKDGETGYMCEPDDVDSFAEAIKKIMSSQEVREEFGQHNKTVAKDFGEVIVDKIMQQIYIDVMIER